MNNNDDINKPLSPKGENEFGKTLDSTIAESIEVGATIKATIISENSEMSNVTLINNDDDSQTFVFQKQNLIYQQQTVFDENLNTSTSDDDIEKTIIDTGQNSNDLSNSESDSEKTIIRDTSDSMTMVFDSAVETVQKADKGRSISSTTVDSGQTLIDSASEKETVGESEIQGRSGEGGYYAEQSSHSAGTISFSGGSISVNVRPRNVASTISANGSSQTNNAGLMPFEFSDFELIEKLGEGGMGIVYSARQSSIDRAIALKMIKSDVVSEEAKSKFLVEAVVTGDLDHPNIVPVHDLGVDSSGNIFYAMKQVSGVEWSKAIKEKSKSENIEILLRVCDAVAFAHDRGVIHRDLKPENVMLGAFGEVLLMDWGLALAVNNKAKAEAVGPNIGIAGTPAYLAPEMARAGAWKMLGFCSDIYLLGAILFEIITGKRPHTGKNVLRCLKNAAKNIFVEVDQKGELIDIAYKAMATNPADRYKSVKEFQKAIRDYLSHSESIMLSDKAEKYLEVAEKSEDYDDYAKALFGFRQAVDLWVANTSALEGEIRTGVAYAKAALNKGDLDLGLSLVTPAKEFESVREELLAAKEIRETHKRRLKLLTRGVTALGAAIVVISVIAAIWIQRERAVAVEQREEAVKQEQIAIEQREEAKKQAKIAEEQRKEAKKQELIAKEQEKIANEKKLLAQAETQRANEQAHIAEEQRSIALKEKAIAEAETKRANEQTIIANKAREVAETERERAKKSEEKALDAIEKMVTAQNQEQLERAKREAAELTAKETQAELVERDELKENKWWTFDSSEAKSMQARVSKEYNLPLDKDLVVNDVSIDFKLIPPGIYGMGSRVDEVGRSSEEYLHKVEISKPFYIADTEMTLKAWNAITGEKEKGEGNYPVWNVSYDEIKNNLIPVVKSKLPEGWDVRLPTEAEWEWAARAGTNTPYYSGSDKEDLINIGFTGVELLTSAKSVKQLEPNAWGLYDMIGNLAEWCEDMYVRDGYLSNEKIQVDPVITSGGKHYVVRGGAWSNLPEHCRAAYRSYANKTSKYNFLGFRLVLLPPVE